jgi:hypothetical protein
MNEWRVDTLPQHQQDEGFQKLVSDHKHDARA